MKLFVRIACMSFSEVDTFMLLSHTPGLVGGETLHMCYIMDHDQEPVYRFIVTVMLLLCTSKLGGNPCHNTSRSLRYDSLASSLSDVPSPGDGSVVNITADSALCWVISSLSIRCCARLGRSLKDSGIAAWPGYPDAGFDWGSVSCLSSGEQIWRV